MENLTGAPALDIPSLDVAATAASYGVPGTSVTGRDALRAALEQALGESGPRLVQVEVAAGMALA
jgi:thiamine pyrophosphate-dependent acetolactate synthase large subunit-like protein